jgi:hypothetical protein
MPIALASNVLRITITGLCYDAFGNHYGGAFFHDAAGWLMMPLGLVFLGVELWILRTLLPDGSDLVAPPPSPASPLPLDASPLALYRSGQTPRREKAAPVPAPEPVAP